MTVEGYEIGNKVINTKEDLGGKIEEGDEALSSRRK